MARRKQGGFELIASMPWPVGFVLGIVGYVAVRYGIAWYFSSAGGPALAAVGKASQGSAFSMLAWILLGICWLAALLSFISSRHRSNLLETQTGLDSLRGMSWRQFEMLVGEAFRRQGYSVEETGLGGADGGVDLILRKGGRTALVQCKQWRNQRVDVKVVREMYGLLAHHGANSVKIVSVGDYTSDARRFAQSKPIELVTGDALLALVRTEQTVQNTKAPRPAVAPMRAPASSSTPDCPKCGAVMLKRENRATRQTFWGCQNYPRCRGTRPA
jgi:restriction system protein